jgi:hypothetical protein
LSGGPGFWHFEIKTDPAGAEKINTWLDTQIITEEPEPVEIEKYVDLTEYGAQHTINQYLANGWYIKSQGLTIIILGKRV